MTEVKGGEGWVPERVDRLLDFLAHKFSSTQHLSGAQRIQPTDDGLQVL